MNSKYYTRGCTAIIGGVVGILFGYFFLSGQAFASVYGGGSYSSCSYQAGCGSASPTPIPQTIITTPSNLDFTVNLADGQSITAGSYGLTVSPMDSQGRTFQRVEFYVDGTLNYTAAPSSNGTFHWQWNTPSPGSHKISLMAYEQGSANPTIRKFSLTITPPPAKEQPSNVLSVAAHAITDTVRKAIQQIPEPVAIAIPYLLFGLLGANILLLILQSHQEVARAEMAEAELVQKRAIASDKETFVQLASHYFNTPIALISGGLDLGVFKKFIDEPKATAIRDGLTDLKKIFGQLIEEINALKVVVPETGVAAHVRIWLTPGFLLPLLLLGGVAVGFNALSVSFGRVSGSLINTLTQAALFGILATALYMLIRGRILRAKARKEREFLLNEEMRVDQAKNRVIHIAAETLTAELVRIRAGISQITDPDTTRMMTNGCDRLETMAAAFSMASKLESGQSGEPFEPFDSGALVEAAIHASDNTVTTKRLSLNRRDSALVNGRRPDLLQVVVSSIIHNAATYSSDGGSVDVGVDTAGNSETSLIVADHGQGLSQEHLQRLFRPFTKAEGALTFDHEGMGFSLYLDKLIMTYLGGRIALQSSPGKGTTATIAFQTSPQSIK